MDKEDKILWESALLIAQTKVKKLEADIEQVKHLKKLDCVRGLNLYIVEIKQEIKNLTFLLNE